MGTDSLSPDQTVSPTPVSGTRLINQHAVENGRRRPLTSGRVGGGNPRLLAIESLMRTPNPCITFRPRLTQISTVFNKACDNAAA